MCSYHGGKQRIGKKIAQVIYDESIDIEDEYDFVIKGYCEPFCGMLGVFYNIPELFDDDMLKYKAGDVNKSIIMMWKDAQNGWVPPTTSSETVYNKLKTAPDSAMRGYIGHQYSFGGQFFNGYAPKYGKTKSSQQASKRIQLIATTLKNTSFSNKTYTQYSNLKGYIIYCDPPYDKSVKRYYSTNNNKLVFDHNKFWDWCRDMAKNNIIFVSSYDAPKDFELVFSSYHKLTGIGSGKNDKRRTEKLFIAY